jgi:CheY-like chemotaxis protein
LARVLVVDDYDDLRSLIVIFLNLYSSFQVVGEAVNGNEAVQMVEQLKPEIVLMDYMMPIMDGLAATRLIKEQYPDIFVISYSGGEEGESIQQFKEAGADLHLTKPLDLEALVKSMKKILSANPDL